MNLTQQRLSELLRYEPETGHFYWRETRARGALRDGIAGGVCTNGYLNIKILGRRYLSHRLAWLYMHGRWPKHTIDHINGDKADNRALNLREATHSENQCNRKPQRNNSSGVVGVSWHAKTRKWRADIKFRGQQKTLGYYETVELAAKARAAAAKSVHKEFYWESPRLL